MAESDAPVTIQPQRLKQARLACGLTQNALAKEFCLTRQAISQYENGTSTPRIDTIKKYLELGFPYEFFITELRYTQKNAIFFRKMRTANEELHGKQEMRIEWLGEIVQYIRKYITLLPINIPKISNRSPQSPDDFEDIAQQIRKQWAMGDGPIQNLPVIIENNGGILTKLEIEHSEVDACSTLDSEGRPFVCLSSQKSAVRSNFDLAHELGHLVLHKDIEPTFMQDKELYKETEQTADRLAGPFLMPKRTFGEMACNITTLEGFLRLKPLWRTSVAAMIYRAKTLGFLTDTQHLNLQKQISKRGWRKGEPLDDVIQHDKPYFLHDATELLIKEKVVSVRQMINSLALPTKEVANILGISDQDVFWSEKMRPILA